MNARVKSLTDVLLVVAALSVAGILVKREFFPSAISSQVGAPAPRFDESWESLMRDGARSGPSSAPVKVVEFFDLQCPSCRSYNEQTLRVALKEFEGKISITYVHFPLSNHPHARIAARAVECAGEQKAFTQMVDVVYQAQDSIGKKPWADLAKDAGVVDNKRFQSCMTSTHTDAQVESGVKEGQRLKIRGTPTIVVNGWLFDTPPSLALLTRTIQSIVKDGKASSSEN